MKESSQGTLQIFSCMRKRCSFRKNPYFPPGRSSLGALLLRKQHPPGLARLGRHNNGRERRAPLPPASPGGPMTAPMASILPQYTPDEVPRP